MHVIWSNYSLSFSLDDLTVEEVGNHFHSNKSLRFYSGGHTFKVYESICNFEELKSIFMEPTPNWWDKELFPWKGKSGT